MNIQAEFLTSSFKLWIQYMHFVHTKMSTFQDLPLSLILTQTHFAFLSHHKCIYLPTLAIKWKIRLTRTRSTQKWFIQYEIRIIKPQKNSIGTSSRILKRIFHANQKIKRKQKPKPKYTVNIFMRAATASAPAPTPWLNNNIIKCVYNMQCTKVPHTNLPKNNFLLVSLLLFSFLFFALPFCHHSLILHSG